MKPEIIAKVVVLAAAFALAAHLFGIDVERLKRVHGLGYVVVACALWLAFQRDYYLSFLGRAVFPAPVLGSNSTPEKADAQVVVSVEPNSKVIYWAAEAGQHSADPWTAYGSYTNAGVALADGKGKALLRFRRPRTYSVRTGRRLPAHVHYRSGSKGMMGPVQTVGL